MGATRKLSPLVLVFFYLAVAHGSGCRSGWTQYKNKCYMFSRMPEPWGMASSYCQAYHSKLAEPVTPEESAFLTSHAHNLHDTFWIGITDLMAENEWVYSSNLQRVQTTNWASHEPNGKGGENCAVLFYPRHSQWADLHCDAHERFICEMSEDESGPMILG
eukprot:XP_011424364.1 PREDICTED: perlucin-like protein [Crassostrea gigas]